MSVTKTVRRTQSARLAPSDPAISFIFMNAWRMRASSPSTSLLSTGLMPRMPAMNTKSPARAPRLQVPVGSIAPLGASTETRLVTACRSAKPAPTARRPHAPMGARRAGLQSERMQHAAHLPLECLVDQLMLLHARLALERWSDDGRGIVVAVA